MFVRSYLKVFQATSNSSFNENYEKFEDRLNNDCLMAGSILDDDATGAIETLEVLNKSLQFAKTTFRTLSASDKWASASKSGSLFFSDGDRNWEFMEMASRAQIKVYPTNLS